MAKKRLGVLISGGGTNLEAIINACETGILKSLAEVTVVVSNKDKAFGLERAKKHGIPAVFLNPKECAENDDYCSRVSETLKKYGVELICLAGYMNMISSNLVKEYSGRMLNIHPALLPKYGGKGMYGHHVHEAVIKAGDKESGVTVHIVDEQYDHGSIVLQKKVPVMTGDTPETLAKRVLEVEHKIYPEAILKVISGKL